MQPRVPRDAKHQSLSDVMLNARAVQADVNLNQGFYIHIFIYLFIWMCAQTITMALT